MPALARSIGCLISLSALFTLAAGCGGDEGVDSTPITSGTSTSTSAGGSGGANTGGGGAGGANTGTGGTGGTGTGGAGGSAPACADPTPDACGQDCVDLATDLLHCGDCATACVVGDHAAVACESSQCVVTCDLGYADVDHDPATGCEVDLSSDPKHCGAVDKACAIGPCVDQVCTCDDSATNGDETDFNCGGSCAPCANDKLCKLATDCASEICTEMPDQKSYCEPAFQLWTPKSTALPNFVSATSLAAGSFNKNLDPHLDVTLGGQCTSDSCIGAFLGDGAGGLPTAKLPSALSSAPLALASADLNGDGSLDVVSVGGDKVHVALGNGLGNFGPITTTKIDGSDLVSVAAGALVGVAHVDVIAVDSAGSIHVLYGKGDGTFEAPKTIAIAGASAVAVGRVDASGDDILVTSRTAGTVTLLLGKPADELAITATFQLGSDRKPSFIQVADVNHDNRLDVATANDDKTASVLLGDGVGGFAVKHWPTGVVPSGLAVGKLTMSWEKKELDLAVTDKNDASLVVLINRGELSSTFKIPAVVALPNKATSLLAADLNADTWHDLVVTTTSVADGLHVLMTSHIM